MKGLDFAAYRAWRHAFVSLFCSIWQLLELGAAEVNKWLVTKPNGHAEKEGKLLCTFIVL